MIRIVLDTNVLVSGLLSDNTPPAIIVDLIMAVEIQAVYDRRILTEYRRVLSRPALALDPGIVNESMAAIESLGLQVTPLPWPHALPDETDEPFLAVAYAGAAFALVTGNIKHYPKELRREVRVFTPREFLDAFRREHDQA